MKYTLIGVLIVCVSCCYGGDDCVVFLSSTGTLSWSYNELPIFEYNVHYSTQLTGQWDTVSTTESHFASVSMSSNSGYYRVSAQRIPERYLTQVGIEDNHEAAVSLLLSNRTGTVLDVISSPGTSVIDMQGYTSGRKYIYYTADGYASQWVSIHITNEVPTPDQAAVTMYRKRYVIINYAFNTNDLPNVKPGTQGVVTGRYAVAHWGGLPYFRNDWQVWQKADGGIPLFGDTPYLDWHRYDAENGFISTNVDYNFVETVPTSGYVNVDIKAISNSVIFCRITGHTSSTRGYGKLLVESVTESPSPEIPVID